MRQWMMVLAGVACLSGVACKAPAQQQADSAEASAAADQSGMFPVIVDDMAEFEYATTMTTLPPFAHGEVAVFQDPTPTDEMRMIMLTRQVEDLAPGLTREELARNVMMAGASGETKFEITSQTNDAGWVITTARATVPGETAEGSVQQALKLTDDGYMVVLGIFDKEVAGELTPRWRRFYRSVRPR